MSYPVMPDIMPWSLVKGGFHKGPSFNNAVHRTPTGRGNTAAILKPYATWAFTVDLSSIDGGEAVQYSVLQRFLGVYLATCGSGSPFLFTDPNDNTVDDTGLSIPQSCLLNLAGGITDSLGDGVTTQFQLGRRIDQGLDIIQQASNGTIFINNLPCVSGSGLPTVTVSNTGVVTFSPAPAAGVVLGWSGNFQYLCRFTDDTLKDLARVNKNSQGFLWECPSIAFESEFL